MTEYYGGEGMNKPLVEGNQQEALYGERVNNFPPCKPFIHHNIRFDIEPDKQQLVRRGYVGWWFHAFCLFFNFVVMLGAVTQKFSIGGFFVSAASMILGIPISFWVYWQFYKATRDNSAARYMFWFVLFFIQLLVTAFFAIGIASYGCAGFWLMVETFNDNNMALGILAAVSTFLWIAVAIYNAFIFYSARLAYKDAGGHKQAAKQMTTAGVKTAYDNRQVIGEVIRENKDTIKQVAIENKDTIIQFAKDNKDTIKQVALENKDAIARVAIENKDTVWENREVISSVFDDGRGSRV